jgi:hypothetical protein
MRLVGLFPVAFLAVTLLAGAGCASRDRDRPPIDQPASIERPAKPIDEEQGLADKIGEVGVALLVVSIVIAGIVLPLILL